jgi:hypothetical protein
MLLRTNRVLAAEAWLELVNQKSLEPKQQGQMQTVDAENPERNEMLREDK